MIVHKILAVSVAVSALGCESAPMGGGGGGTSAPVTSGGAVGATCPKDDQIGCAPGALAKVRCKNAQWIADGACATGTQCLETKTDGVVVATACILPSTLRTNRAIACAKAAACGTGLSFSTCMNPPSSSVITAVAKAFGYFEAGKGGIFDLEAKIGCYSSAKDCAAVTACVAGSVAKCASNDADACVGSVARICSGGATIAVDCAAVGLGCSMVEGQPMCGSLPNCTNPKSVTCQGDTAKVCLPVGKGGQSYEISMNCAYFGGKCDGSAKAQADLDVCNFATGATCDQTTYKAICQGNHQLKCSSGKVQMLDCASFGEVCEVKAGVAHCTITTHCDGGSGCEGGLYKFCDGSLGLRSFDCSKAGMICPVGGGKCEFAKP